MQNKSKFLTVSRKELFISAILIILCLVFAAGTSYAQPNSAPKKSNGLSNITTGDRSFMQPANNILFQTQSTDADLLNLADLIVRASPKVSRVWSGFWAKDQSFVLLKPKERALLITAVAPTAEYTVLTGENIPKSLRGRVYAHQNYPPIEANGDLAFRVGNAFAPALEPQKATGKESEEFRQLNYLYHEWFHGFQRNGLFTPAANEPQVRFRQPMVPPDRIADPKFTEMAELERRILIAALQTPSKKRLRPLLQQYLAVRFLRTEFLPDVHILERHFERYEGSATLVGLQSAVVATSSPEEQVSDWIMGELQRKMDSFPASPTPDSRLLRWRVYSTGAAIGLLLDMLKINWRKSLETGTDSLDALLVKAVRFNSAKAKELAKEAAATFKVK